jgi:hypothetical protein
VRHYLSTLSNVALRCLQESQIIRLRDASQRLEVLNDDLAFIRRKIDDIAVMTTCLDDEFHARERNRVRNANPAPDTDEKKSNERFV